MKINSMIIIKDNIDKTLHKKTDEENKEINQFNYKNINYSNYNFENPLDMIMNL